ncbi:MAG: GtrA family protein [Betaproteobacteria bacterium]|nr:GtrA family protein [Betaproteobacteria bacterium]
MTATRAVLREGLAYGVASALSLGVDLGVLFALVRVGLPAAPASAIGYAAGLVIHYLLAIRLVFVHRRFRSTVGFELGLYAATGVAGLLMTVAIVAAGQRLGFSLAFAKGVAVLASFVVVYLVRRALMFSAPRKRPGRGDG